MKPLIDQAFWADPQVEASESDVKLAALWLLTNGQTSMLGICSATTHRFQFETKLPPDTLESAVQALPAWFERFGPAIFIPSYVRCQFGAGEKLMRNNFFPALKSQFATVKDPALRAAILAEYPEFDQALQTPSKGLPKPKDGKEGEERTGQEGSGAAGSAHRDETPPPSALPTRAEAQAYGRELAMDAADVDAWYDHFESNGWRVSGKAPMCDWRAALRNGSRRRADFKPRNGHSPGPPKLPPEYLQSEWPDWLKSKGQPLVDYQFAADFLKSDFHRERKRSLTLPV